MITGVFAWRPIWNASSMASSTGSNSLRKWVVYTAPNALSSSVSCITSSVDAENALAYARPVDKPNAPASRLSRNCSRIAPISSGEALRNRSSR
ncbi:hypothetical protein D3C87_1657050 [compost metagenome]